MTLLASYLVSTTVQQHNKVQLTRRHWKLEIAFTTSLITCMCCKYVLHLQGLTDTTAAASAPASAPTAAALPPGAGLILARLARPADALRIAASAARPAAGCSTP
jgi:hypothetical protein